MYKIRANNKQGKTDVISILVFVGLFFVLLVYSNLCSYFDFWIQDFWQRLRVGISRMEDKNPVLNYIFPSKSTNYDIVLIMIDDSAILGISGLFEGNRSLYAKALNNLYELNPKVVGLDLLFTNSTSETSKQDDELVDAINKYNDKIVIKAFRGDDNRFTPAFASLNSRSAPSYFKNYIDEAIRSVSLYIDFESSR
ncbi:MAG: CHASE2 domain-containing protein, partial [Candidatus Riflebacteria bacterium]|nr:CHASE2 domain-containing protein [Candidatus Riflebacteria bacterium]